MRIAVAEIGQETDSFSPLATGLESFEQYGLYLGDEILEKMQGVGMSGSTYPDRSTRWMTCRIGSPV